MFYQSNDTAIEAGIGVPPAYGVDYSDAEEVCGYRRLLCRLFERAGGFNCPGVTNALIRSVVAEGRVWLRETGSLIASILSAPIPPHPSPRSTLHIPHSTFHTPPSPLTSTLSPLLTSYDLLHRVCNGCPCYGYLREAKLKAADRWLRGDRTISKTDVTLLLLQEARRDSRTLERRYSDFCIRVMGTWIDELTRYGRFRSTPYPEALRCLGYLLGEDLFVYISGREQSRIKREWTSAYAVDDVAMLDTPTLLEYIGFILAATRNGLYPCGDYDELYIHLWTEYAGRPDVNRFDRAAVSVECGEVSVER